MVRIFLPRYFVKLSCNQLKIKNYFQARLRVGRFPKWKLIVYFRNYSISQFPARTRQGRT